MLKNTQKFALLSCLITFASSGILYVTFRTYVMEITPELVEKLAGIIHLSITEKEKASLTNELSKIIAWTKQLSEVTTTTSNVSYSTPDKAPLHYPGRSETPLPIQKVFPTTSPHNTTYFTIPPVAIQQ